MKKLFLLILLGVILLNNSNVSLAKQGQTKINSLKLMPSSDQLLITEVNFKSTENDFLKISYYSPEKLDINLKGLEFMDDKVFKKIESDFIISSGNSITLNFKSENNDIDGKALFTKTKGLTSTTEQIFIKNEEGKIIDAVCWTNQNPTSKEKTDLQKIFNQENWISSDISSCIESEKIENNELIVRKSKTIDTNSKNDWIIEKNQKTDVTEIKKKKRTYNNSKSLEQKDKPLNSNSKKTHSVKKPHVSKDKKTKKQTSKKKKKLYTDGDISDQIIINEIFSHAKKEDKKNEWIELYNQGDKKVSLENWILDDEENGSRPYVFPSNVNIEPKGFLLISAQSSKLSLGNKKDQVRLFDYKKTLLQSVEYEEAPADESFSRTIIDKEDGTSETKWLWTKNLTPSKINPIYQEFNGEITKDAEFGDVYFFLFRGKDQNIKKITFNEKDLPGPMAKAIFTAGTKIEIMVIADENNHENYFLKNYEVIETKSNNTSSKGIIFGSLLTIGSIIAMIILIIFKKSRKKIDRINLKAP